MRVSVRALGVRKQHQLDRAAEQFAECRACTGLTADVPHVTPVAQDLLGRLLHKDASMLVTAAVALKHAWVQEAIRFRSGVVPDKLTEERLHKLADTLRLDRLAASMPVQAENDNFMAQLLVRPRYVLTTAKLTLSCCWFLLFEALLTLSQQIDRRGKGGAEKRLRMTDVSQHDGE